MDIKGLLFWIMLILLVWFLLGFIAFLMETKHTRSYTRFDNKTKEDFIFIVCLGLLSFIIVTFLILKENFEDWMDDLLQKINRE